MKYPCIRNVRNNELVFDANVQKIRAVENWEFKGMRKKDRMADPTHRNVRDFLLYAHSKKLSAKVAWSLDVTQR